MRKRKNRATSGFTLIELMIVFAIFAIIVFAVSFGLSGSQQSKAEEIAERTGRRHWPDEKIVATCSADDSDSDGKVSCVITHNGNTEQFECPSLTSVGGVANSIGRQVYCSPMKARAMPSHQ